TTWSLLAIHGGDALDGEIVALGGAAREDDFLGIRTDQHGNLLTRLFHGLFGLPAENVVSARGVAELLREVREHRLHHARIGPRGGVVVHVNRELNHKRSYSERYYASIGCMWSVPICNPSVEKLGRNSSANVTFRSTSRIRWCT